MDMGILLYNIPNAIFYLLKGHYRLEELPVCDLGQL